MPRSKFVDSQYTLQYAEIGYFKEQYPDYLFDFKLIYQDLMNDLIDFKEAEAEVKLKYEILNKLKVKPTLSNRVYIITSYDSPVLAMVNMDESVVDNLIKEYQYSFCFEDVPERIMGSYISTLYIFKGEKMCLNTHISPFKVAMFTSVFKAENLVNYQGWRDTLYAKPRRERKKSTKIT